MLILSKLNGFKFKLTQILIILKKSI